MTLLLIYISLALSVSFLCSVLEAVLLSITPGYIATQKQEGTAIAERLIAFKRDIDRPLAAILSLNTIAHTVGAAGAGAQAAVVFGEGYLGVASAVLTLLILVVSEIIPKTLGALYWRRLTPFMVRTLGPIVIMMWPLVKLAQLITVRLAHKTVSPTMEREEISAIAELGEEEGVLDNSESRILTNLLQAGALKAADIMTPRIVLFSLDQDTTVQQVLDAHQDIPFSRIPVYDSQPDTVTGYILKDAIYLNAARDEHHLPLHKLRRDIQVVQTCTSVTQVLEQLLTAKEQIALVIDDEYGGVSGVVTIEDIVETVLGVEIHDESDAVTDMQVYAKTRFQARARQLGLDPESLTQQATIPTGHLQLPGGGVPNPKGKNES
jgi:CBS domain containing-hemolysin-like protein